MESKTLFFFFVSELENPCLVFIGGPFNAKKKKKCKEIQSGTEKQ